MRRFLIGFVALCFLTAIHGALATRPEAPSGWGPALPEAMVRCGEAISARSLRAHLSFLASDILQGRPTPSTGQDVAAEYIAAQFRGAGLEPVGSEDYFQSVTMPEVRPERSSFRFEITAGERRLTVPPEHFSMDGAAAVEIERAPAVRLPLSAESLRTAGSLAGKVAVSEAASGPGPAVTDQTALLRRIRELSPRLLILIDPGSSGEQDYFDTPRLRGSVGGRTGERAGRLVARISDPAFAAFAAGLPAGETGAQISLRLREDAPRERTLRNVAGLLRGSDAALKDSTILVTAHYDGTGSRAGAAGDKIWNAANDNGSGTAAVMEIAAALASLQVKPRRSVLFVCFFGEERGFLGSRHYVSHPLVPLERTVSVINLEHLGRTDDPGGSRRGRASLTGFDYSDLGEVFRLAGERLGIAVSGHDRDSDTYFAGSDNVVFAEKGVPAHTLCVSYLFPDYHGAADHWEKIDFDNMEKTVRMTALAVLTLAQSERVPRWNPSNPRAERFLKARQQAAGDH